MPVNGCAWKMGSFFCSSILLRFNCVYIHLFGMTSVENMVACNNCTLALWLRKHIGYIRLRHSIYCLGFWFCSSISVQSTHNHLSLEDFQFVVNSARRENLVWATGILVRSEVSQLRRGFRSNKTSGFARHCKHIFHKIIKLLGSHQGTS